MFSQFNFSGKLEEHPQHKLIFSTNMEKEEQLNNLRRELLVSYLMQETGLQSEYHALQCLVAANWNYNKARTILSENRCSDDLPRILHPTQCILPTQQINEHNNSQNNFQNHNNNYNSQGNSLKVPQPTNSPSSPSSNYSSGEQQIHNFHNKNPSQQSSSDQNSIHNSSSFHNHSSRRNETNQHQSQNSINFMASQMDQMNIRESQNM